MTDQELHENTINTFEELLSFAYDYNKSKQHKDFEKLYSIRKEIKKLNQLVGLSELKDQILYQILYAIQDFQSDEMMHTALMGPPGVGKTTVATILASIYRQLGIVSKGKLIIVAREDLVGQYLGETAIKTRTVLERSIGNILFIDEAYSLGNSGSGNSYSKECIDTITKFLGENTKNFICIIAGYEKQLNECFFKNNPGLDRRFPWKYTLTDYTHNELTSIFINIVKKHNWKLRQQHIIISFLSSNIFQNNSHYFTNNGGDIQNFFTSCKMAHSKRIFGSLRSSWKKFISIDDIKLGFKLFKLNKRVDNSSLPNTHSLSHMYL